MKRGCRVSFVSFHSPPFLGESSKKKVVDLVRLGSWYVSDPDDPPRLGGTLRIGDVVVAEGSFDAVYCDVFDDFGACS